MNIGWSNDVTGLSGKLAHYYIDGKSLCGKWVLKQYMELYDPDHEGSRMYMDCTICERRRKKLKNE